MKSASYIFTRAFLVVAIFAMFFTVHASAHAQTSAIGQVIKEKIATDKENAIENRDERNKVLKQKSSSVSTSTDPRQTFIDGLSISLSNFQNIRDRIAIRADEEASDGKDISAIELILNNVDDEMVTASSSINTFISSSTTNLAQTAIENLRPIKESLQDALDSLKKII